MLKQGREGRKILCQFEAILMIKNKINYECD